MNIESDHPIMLSALEHYAYCPRQCALIHLEQVWSENIYTMRGRDVHEHVHEDSSHELAGVRLERSLPIWSRRLNLTGSVDPGAYWRKLKQRLKTEVSEVVTNCHGLKLEAADGKQYRGLKPSNNTAGSFTAASARPTWEGEK